MSTTFFDYFIGCWNLFMGILTFLATKTALGAYVSDLTSRLGRKLRSWGLEWPELPASPDRVEQREAHARTELLLSQILAERRVTSQALREMMGQDAKHHEEVRALLSETRDISSDALEIAGELRSLPEDVRVMATSSVFRVLRDLPR